MPLDSDCALFCLEEDGISVYMSRIPFWRLIILILLIRVVIVTTVTTLILLIIVTTVIRAIIVIMVRIAAKATTVSREN